MLDAVQGGAAELVRTTGSAVAPVTKALGVPPVAGG
jgi:hypothetical protein